MPTPSWMIIHPSILLMLSLLLSSYQHLSLFLFVLPSLLLSTQNLNSLARFLSLSLRFYLSLHLFFSLSLSLSLSLFFDLIPHYCLLPTPLPFLPLTSGEIGMSDDLDALGDSLFNGFLPALWKRLCPDTQKPLGSWVIHYTQRHEQYEQWINKGEPPCLWLSGLHIPESYLTALVQTTCRMRGWPLDKSTLYTVVTKHTSDKELTRLESGKSTIF